jgi:hypothetical protein
MQLALTDLFRARWTEEILDEWTRNLLANRPDLTHERLQRTRGLMNTSVRDCLVTGYEPLAQGLSLPDPDDRHVLAAAIKCQAGVIVTYNIGDFPAGILGRQGIDAQHPDQFIYHLLDLNPGAVCAAVKKTRARLQSPPKSVDEYLETLERQQLVQVVAQLRQYRSVL